MVPAMDAVFSAWPIRPRELLDELFREDGQTLARSRAVPDDAFGVMKHLKLLEEAGLVVTRRQGARSCTS